ncbi:tRNA N(3)-methylcytidine methyltransferase METTL6-like [Gigantopelta aegis]|uniref:tRNA N(3)-methylcytidine methyltransferase METTL6-like n=1 Tax=Gigantopelta aegis TaxID=1735272 RepID=UPI001B88BE7E|nr:tRNA N(3)-methylcytidine methyltransferase METTL6-like [Gigantopelta aegis]XP_041367406.1 tRNA N(3)-methylcytidine methyltransferase METTL6-like [Gigantopelta aegis]
MDDACSGQTFSHEARTLTEAEASKLQSDKKIVSEFKQNKLEQEAQKNWDIFYKRNTTKFFKDRHWTLREFQELLNDNSKDSKRVLLEVGCGVGNFMFPLLQEDSNLFIYACDFSKRAVQFVTEHPLFDSTRCVVFLCDITEDDLCVNVPPSSVDVVSMIFVLSAIHPDKMVLALKNIHKVLKSGGCILLRDYGLYDYAMLRFSSGHKLADNFYVRQDGTRAYYFSLETLRILMEQAGFTVTKTTYIQRETVNKKEGLCVPRIFVQGTFSKVS